MGWEEVSDLVDQGLEDPELVNSAEAHEPAWPAANDHDGQTRNATSANGWSSAGAPSAELQVHTNCSQPTSPGDARPDGGSRRCSSSTTGGACPGPGASDCHYVGSGSTAGAEADAGREALPIDPAYVPRPGRQDHGDAAGDRQRRARPHA